MSIRYPAGFIRIGYDPLKVPNAPTIGTATAGDTQASVAFTAPSNVGGSAISSYTAVSTPSGISASAASSPITVTGLTNGTAYTFAVWALNTYGPGPYSAASGSVTPAAQRGVFAGGELSSGSSNVMDYVNIATTSNATDFGDLAAATYGLAGCGSATRGVFGGGFAAGNKINVMQYITIASASNTTDFGDLVGGTENGANYLLSSCSSSTRGIFGGGNSGSDPLNNSSVINYITIATTGNATDFGDLTLGRMSLAAFSSPTRGVFTGGYRNYDTWTNVMDYITIASTGNALDFGDISFYGGGSYQGLEEMGGCSSSTRGLIIGGRGGYYVDPDTYTVRLNIIQYITIASLGNTSDFGDLAATTQTLTAASSETRGLAAGGYTTDPTNVISYVTIASIGNATDFGDLTVARYNFGACSNAHGGLQ